MGKPPIRDNPEALQWESRVARRMMVVFYFLVGGVLLFAPDSAFGPTWSYFQYIPHGGFGFGSTLILLGILLLIAIIRRSKRIVSLALSCGGLATYIAALMIMFQGISGGTGFMETWWMMYAAIHMMIKAATVARK